MEQKSKRGGARIGAGRKPKDPAHPKNTDKTIKVSEQVADYLADVGTGIVEDTIRVSKPFREWVKSSGSE